MSQLSAHWNVFDYVILGVVFLSVIVGFFRGFLREVVSLASWFLAFYASLKFSYILNDIFSRFISNPKGAFVAAAITTFVVVLLLGMLVGKILGTLVTTTGLGIFDKLLGLGFGALRGALVVTIILLVAEATKLQGYAWVANSQLAPHFQFAVARFAAMLPKEISSVSAWMQHLNIHAQ